MALKQGVLANHSRYPGEPTQSDIHLVEDKDKSPHRDCEYELERRPSHGPICYENNVQLSSSIADLVVQDRQDDADYAEFGYFEETPPQPTFISTAFDVDKNFSFK